MSQIQTEALIISRFIFRILMWMRNNEEAQIVSYNANWHTVFTAPHSMCLPARTTHMTFCLDPPASLCWNYFKMQTWTLIYAICFATIINTVLTYIIYYTVFFSKIFLSYLTHEIISISNTSARYNTYNYTDGTLWTYCLKANEEVTDVAERLSSKVGDGRGYIQRSKL